MGGVGGKRRGNDEIIIPKNYLQKSTVSKMPVIKRYQPCFSPSRDKAINITKFIDIGN